MSAANLPHSSLASQRTEPPSTAYKVVWSTAGTEVRISVHRQACTSTHRSGAWSPEYGAMERGAWSAVRMEGRTERSTESCNGTAAGFATL